VENTGNTDINDFWATSILDDNHMSPYDWHIYEHVIAGETKTIKTSIRLKPLYVELSPIGYDNIRERIDNCKEHIEEKFTLNFTNNWNYFSIPLKDTNLTLRDLYEKCKIYHIYYYDSEARAYKSKSFREEPNYLLQPGTGYAVRVYSECRIELFGKPWKFKEKRLKENTDYLIGAPLEITSLDKIKGTCNITDLNVIYYDYSNGSQEKKEVRALEPGKSYWFKTKKTCTLGTTMPPQKCTDNTPYGQCSQNKPLYCENGNLIEKCGTCGCPNEQICLANQTCCTPKTCERMKWECGTGTEPNCNTTINCGTCNTGQTCQNHKCIQSTAEHATQDKHAKTTNASRPQ